jgi:ATP-dependent DNA helicase RecG
MLCMDDVQHLLASGESQTVEFKKSTASLRDAIETLCAFANQHGGYVIFGVDDHGTVVGQHVSDDTLKNIANAVKLNTDPKLYPTLEQVDIAGKSCILVTIEESPLTPPAMAACRHTRWASQPATRPRAICPAVATTL